MSDIVGGLIGAGGSLLTSWMNNEYLRQANAATMAREDTAVQRRVADLKAAGLSPTLAAGSAAGSTPIRAASMGDPVAAGSAMMQQQGSVGVSVAEKARANAVARRESALADQEEIRSEAMKNVQDFYSSQLGKMKFTGRKNADGTAEIVPQVDLFSGRGMEHWSFDPYTMREIFGLREGAQRASQAESAASSARTEAEGQGLDLGILRKLGGSPVIGNALIHLLSQILTGTATAATLRAGGKR